MSHFFISDDIRSPLVLHNTLQKFKPHYGDYLLGGTYCIDAYLFEAPASLRRRPLLQAKNSPPDTGGNWCVSMLHVRCCSGFLPRVLAEYGLARLNSFADHC